MLLLGELHQQGEEFSIDYANEIHNGLVLWFNCLHLDHAESKRMQTCQCQVDLKSLENKLYLYCDLWVTISGVRHSQPRLVAARSIKQSRKYTANHNEASRQIKIWNRRESIEFRMAGYVTSLHGSFWVLFYGWGYSGQGWNGHSSRKSSMIKRWQSHQSDELWRKK